MSELAPEDEVRADLYAILARLFYTGPDRALLALIANAEDVAAESDVENFARAWKDLAASCKRTRPEEAQVEYDLLFAGIGRAKVTPYFTHYLAASGREMLLVELKQELGKLGLERRNDAREPEDHVAGLLDVMRHLASAGSGDLSIARQAQFFARFIAPGYRPFCAAVMQQEDASFYRPVARVVQAFLEVEDEALKMM